VAYALDARSVQGFVAARAAATEAVHPGSCRT
jgi:hypothetical protein